jgi:hypothetical protein
VRVHHPVNSFLTHRRRIRMLSQCGQIRASKVSGTRPPIVGLTADPI